MSDLPSESPTEKPEMTNKPSILDGCSDLWCERCMTAERMAAQESAAPSVSSSAPPPTWDEMASMFPDNSKRANRPRGSSAEPAPPTGPWVVWSKDHHAWWGPNRGGYTPNLFDAGLYEEAEAKQIEAQSSPRAGSSLPAGSVSDEARRLSDEIKSRSRYNNVASFFAGSISERERLTARCTQIEQALDRAQWAWSEVEREIPRCANCHDSGWKRIPHDNSDCGQCTAEGRALRDRLRTSHLAASLAKAKQQELQLWRDRVLSEIEALPTSYPTNAIHLEALGWVAEILKRENPNGTR